MEKMYTHKGFASVFGNACRVLLFLQMIACDCGTKPGDDKEKGGGGKPAEEQLKINFTAPSGVEAVGGFTSFRLEIEVVEGELDLGAYKLKAEHIQSYTTGDYDEQNKINDATKYATLSSRRAGDIVAPLPLADLIGVSGTLKKNGKIGLEISPEPSYESFSVVSKSAKFNVIIVDGADNPIGGPLEMKWKES